jgi:hypothetical protein
MESVQRVPSTFDELNIQGVSKKGYLVKNGQIWPLFCQTTSGGTCTTLSLAYLDHVGAISIHVCILYASKYANIDDLYGHFDPF